MTIFRLPLLAILALAASLLTTSRPAHAAESYDNCAGFIDSVPTVITTQGVWCLRQDLSTSITSSSAITIATNNVTIDCNDFKLGGLGAGNGSQANGIFASDRQNTTIRHCNIRGFQYGMRLIGGAGHLVEDNRLDNNLYTGIQVAADNSLVQRNRIYDTGGKSDGQYTYGLYAQGSTNVIDNTVAGLYADKSGGSLTGIRAISMDGTRVSRNTISGYDMTATQGGAVQFGTGIFVAGNYATVAGNHISGVTGQAGTGITKNGGSTAFCVDNTVGGFATALFQCNVTEGNLSLP